MSLDKCRIYLQRESTFSQELLPVGAYIALIKRRIRFVFRMGDIAQLCPVNLIKLRNLTKMHSHRGL